MASSKSSAVKSKATAPTDPPLVHQIGPTKPSLAPEENWIQTPANHGILITVRLYGAGAPFYDQTWRPDDVVKLR